MLPLLVLIRAAGEKPSGAPGAPLWVVGGSGSGISDDADYLIAATVVVVDAELLTTNVRHFPMLPGLQPPY